MWARVRENRVCFERSYFLLLKIGFMNDLFIFDMENLRIWVNERNNRKKNPVEYEGGDGGEKVIN